MTTNAKINRGVYFSADDRVFELALAFLNSFRKYNPSMALCLIPFNCNIHQLKEIQQEYHFSIYSNEEALAFCDEISRRFHKKVCGQYRKLLSWEGDFEEFIYIDVDTIILESVDFVFEYLRNYAFIVVNSNIAYDKKWVWKDSIGDSGQLTSEQIAYAANSGFIASRKCALNLETVRNKLEPALSIKIHMELKCIEQPFLNFLIVTSGELYTSLRTLYYQEPHDQNIKLELWAGKTGFRVNHGKIDTQGKHPPVLFVHWAGQWQYRFFDRIIYYLLKLAGLKKKTDEPLMCFLMPYKKLWKYYRYNKI